MGAESLARTVLKAVSRTYTRRTDRRLWVIVKGGDRLHSLFWKMNNRTCYFRIFGQEKGVSPKTTFTPLTIT